MGWLQVGVAFAGREGVQVGERGQLAVLFASAVSRS
jgi:hypothetical protein